MIAFKTLIPLQDLDLKIDSENIKIQDKKQKVLRMLNNVDEEAQLNDKKIALLKKIQVRKRHSEASFNDLVEKSKIIEIKMKNAGVAPSIYKALEKELAFLNTSVGKFETKVLEDMEKNEMLKADVEKNIKILDGRREHLVQIQQKTASEIKEHKQKIELLKTEKSQMSLGVSCDLLEKYEELRHEKRGQVIYGIDAPSCPKCGIGISASLLSLLKSHEDAEVCTNCGVWLYWIGVRE